MVYTYLCHIYIAFECTLLLHLAEFCVILCLCMLVGVYFGWMAAFGLWPSILRFPENYVPNIPLLICVSSSAVLCER